MLIGFGARGERIKDIQSALNEAGYGPLTADGVYGKLTHTAVKLFQKAAGLAVDGVVGPKTMMALSRQQTATGAQRSADPPAIIRAIEAMDYLVYEDGKINIIGVRRTNDVEPNKFDDDIYLAWVGGGEWQSRCYPCTTDPGTYWLESPMRVDGTAIMVPGQYVDAYCWGLHRGNYETLVNRGPGGPVKVYRDANKDDILDMDPSTIEEGHGLNLHHAGTDSSQVNRWSAGCQVFKRLSDWHEAMAVWKASDAELFTYTLINDTDLTS